MKNKSAGLKRVQLKKKIIGFLLVMNETPSCTVVSQLSYKNTSSQNGLNNSTNETFRIVHASLSKKMNGKKMKCSTKRDPRVSV